MSAEVWTILSVGIALGGLVIGLGGFMWWMLQSFRNEMDRRFEQVDRRFEQVDKRFEQVDKRFEQVDSRFEQVESRFEQIDKRFEQIDRRFEQVAECIREVRRQIARLADDHNAFARELSELRGEIRGRLDERARPAPAD